MPSGVYLRASAAERFWKYVEKKRGCWGWGASKSEHGYPLISISGRSKVAHRLSWEIHNGPIPKGLLVCHKCDNPICTNPKHLFLGSQRDNLKDMSMKWRHWRQKISSCPKGHPYSGENLRINIRKNGIINRVCRACERAAGNKYYKSKTKHRR